MTAANAFPQDRVAVSARMPNHAGFFLIALIVKFFIADV
jgi:hypothetical protein